ncbi:MAG: hypothetical protein P1U68_12440 [Verrucomicrobiales bacterium]|nr:hypothetical protein [Verrucomicrobiales bacterium]
MVCDLLYFDREVPTFPHSREIDLSKVEAVRKSLSARVSWTVIFIKAFAIIARERPVLRQAWMKYPFPRLYQNPESIAYLPVKRTHDDEEWLCFAPFSRPEGKSLDQLQARLDSYQREPVDEVFRTQYRSAFLPTFLRRLIIGSWFRCFAKRRVKRMGTFGITTVSSRGAEIQFPPGVHTTTLTYGPMDETGKSRVTLHYDHRLMDGWFIAEVLEDLERVLNQEIFEELKTLQS